ncbi:hypothetical protein [Halomonas getboli]|uniref:hypothetical protein n=1 Tax=Halomonas getboli TaxID=2935862 RepID=UPI001FFEAD32|nr:hypothetical protein [Halomonas getboli]MCK2182469.1 hypothetical protein [Halomonas getboli]
MSVSTFFSEVRRRSDRPLNALLAAAGLAIWLLYHPGLVQELAWPWRGAMALLGAWAMGCAFARPLAMTVGERGAWRLVHTRWSRAALPLFALLLVGRGLLG